MTPNDIHDQVDDAARELTPVPVVPFTGRAAAHALLVLRLVDNHGLTPPAAEAAVRAAEAGEPSEHTELVDAEARAAAAEMGQQLTQTIVHAFRVMQPAMEAAAAAARKFAEAFQAATDAQAPHGEPVKRPDRPAWTSPYGPPPRRR